MGLLVIFTIFNGHGTPIAFYIVKGGGTFVKVSGYSVHVSFLLFREKDRTNSTGGDGGLYCTNQIKAARREEKRREEKRIIECYAYLDNLYPSLRYG